MLLMTRQSFRAILASFRKKLASETPGRAQASSFPPSIRRPTPAPSPIASSGHGHGHGHGHGWPVGSFVAPHFPLEFLSPVLRPAAAQKNGQGQNWFYPETRLSLEFADEITITTAITMMKTMTNNDGDYD